MGLYAFIFGTIGLGILLWFIKSAFSDYLPVPTEEVVDNAGTLLFLIGLGSLGTTLIINFFRR